MARTIAGIGSALSMMGVAAAHAGGWTGPYAGVEATSTNSAVTYCLSCVTDVSNWSNAPAATAGFGGQGGGVFGGYNFALGSSVVLGVEGSYGVPGGNVAQSLSTFYLPPNGYVLSVGSISSLRVRAGYAAGNALFYVTGGVGFAEVLMNNPANPSTIGLSTTVLNTTQQGTVLGGGIEYMLNDRMTLRAQYLAYNFSTPAISEQGGGYYESKSTMVSSSVSVGVAYTF